MPDPHTTEDAPPGAGPADAPRAAWGWGPWIALGWVLLILLVALAELAHLRDLRLALDLERLFRP